LQKLIAVGDGYVALPGGTGTLVELAVAWEMIHKRLMPAKPLVVLGEFWRPVVELVESLDGNSRGMVILSESVSAATEILRKLLPAEPDSSAILWGDPAGS
jgi:predicted Rossmann-fold nucleotide-binding protein